MTQILNSPVVQTQSRKIRPMGTTPPVIILGGGANALSVTRSLGKLGAKVYALNEPDGLVYYSRYCQSLDAPRAKPGEEKQLWPPFLLGPQTDALTGAILLACSDAGIEIIAEHRDTLSQKFILDECNPVAQRTMLNKLATYQEAVAANVPTPLFWLADSADELADVRKSLVYPLIVKPRYSHIFEAKSGKKLIVCNTYEETAAAVEKVTATGTGCLLVEMIPGGDDQLCSYITYLDDNSKPLLHFTKRVIRRYPPIMGLASYHITDWNPEVAEVANRLFRHVGLRGVANVEFKRDTRDGKLKLIECNARFVASDPLLTRSGFELSTFVYNRLAGRPQPVMRPYKRNLRLWDPIRDFQSYRLLRKTGQLHFLQWLGSVAHRQTFAYFNWSDPMPSVARLTSPIRKKFRGKSK